MKSHSDNPSTFLTWSKANNIIAMGYKNGTINLSVVTTSHDQPGTPNIENIQTIEFHKKEITALSWSDNGRFLSCGDKSGKITFWTKKGKTWKHVLTNSTVASPVTYIRWSKRCDMVAICYEDSTCACVTSDGDLNWSVSMRQSVKFVEWTITSGSMLCGTTYGEVMIIDSRGVETGTMQMPCLNNSTADPKLIGLEWNKKANYGLLVAYEGGQIQLNRNETDSEPIVISVEMECTSISWLRNGAAFAVAGIKSSGKCVVLFISEQGNILRELDVSGQRITHLAFDPIDTQVAMAVGNFFYLAQIIPQFNWAFDEHTLVYSYNNSDIDEHTIAYFNYKTDEKRIHNIGHVLAIAGNNGYFAVVTKLPGEEALLSITDSISVNVTSAVIPFQPFKVAVYNKAVAAVSEHKVCVWKFDEEDSPQYLDITDNITALLLRDKFVLIFAQPNIIKLDVPSLNEISKIPVDFSAESIKLSSDELTLAAFDSAGTLKFINMTNGQTIGPEKKEVWNMEFSSDSPNQFAALERQKLYIYNDLQEEEPIPSISHIASFSNLEILCVDLIRIMNDPLHPRKRFFKSYPTKQLRDLRIMLSSRPQTDIETIISYCKTQDKPRLWEELGETSMLEMNLTLAEKCFLETTDYKSLQFLKRIRSIKDTNIQRAQILTYLGRFDEAQSIYSSMDRNDLSIEMRNSIGDYEHIINIIGKTKLNSDESNKDIYTNVGDNFMERNEYQFAADFYDAAGNYEKLMKCLYLMDDYQGLENLMLKLPNTSDLLPKLGRLFISIGSINNAVMAFKTYGDISSAIDACARLNHWKTALELAGKSKTNEIRNRMNKYAKELIDNGQTAAAIDFYSRAGLDIEAAKLLQNEGDSILKENEDYLSAKMCYIFAALQLEKHRQQTFDGANTISERIEGLIKEDETISNGLLNDIWKKAEGIHFYMLAHRFMFAKQWMDALVCACRVFDDYADVIGEDKAAALLVSCSLRTKHFGQCSRAMTILEHFDDYPKEKREKFEELSIEIFSRNKPVDPNTFRSVTCPKCRIGSINALQSQCLECGYHMKLCVMTGRLITADALECKVCRHAVGSEQADDIEICPLCHHQFYQ
ncbi:WD repeat-containing protein 35 [Histomonas meleagridis]|uniref:WD repeat-containing protein 35 n=1 Tax=Histomonas meleagridis TaxID=135588 RepID=UPI003559BC93|nr:WD repeat-containing protein 35 [Histomonas meleagridis]KAH0797710.1 WD repeat-containing protein 35 [Histomonas meleagridis]